MAKPRVLVYVPLNPVTPKIFARTITSVFNMTWDAPIDVMFGRHDHPPAHKNDAYREITAKYNHARETALRGDYDALLTVEADMIVPAITLERLTRIDADVAYGLYCSRRGAHQWLAYKDLGEKSGTSYSKAWNADQRRAAWGSVIPSAGVGLGCTLIWRRVLEDVKFRNDAGVTNANDWYFSIDLQARGYRQAHDLGVVCGHIQGAPSPKIIWPDPDEIYRLEFFDEAPRERVNLKTPLKVHVGEGTREIFKAE